MLVGTTHLKKIANLAEIYQVRTGRHGATDLSPVTMAAALYFDLSVHNLAFIAVWEWQSKKG